MTDAQREAVEALSVALKAEKWSVDIEEEENGDRVFLRFGKYYGDFVGWYTILPDGRREFGRR